MVAAVSQHPCLALEPFMLLWQEPRASQRWTTSGNRCLKSGPAHGFAAASLQGATTPPVCDLTETCASVRANRFTAVPSFPSLWSLLVNSNTHSSPAMLPSAVLL